MEEFVPVVHHVPHGLAFAPVPLGDGRPGQ